MPVSVSLLHQYGQQDGSQYGRGVSYHVMQYSYALGDVWRHLTEDGDINAINGGVGVSMIDIIT